MRKMAIGFALVTALAVPVVASAALSPTDFKNASKFCKALAADTSKGGMGETAFKQAYGTNHNRSNAHGKCVSKTVHIVDDVHASAVAKCTAERDANEAAFNEKYGVGKKNKNALHRCISQQEKALTSAKQDDIVNASKKCRSERAGDRAGFATKWGTNKNNRNAFGRCVSHEAASNA
jgi:hypothetical protein